ncbi:MAG: DUF721 domain-containing protein [Lysobacterales bacterium]|jgi:hypothetical protein
MSDSLKKPGGQCKSVQTLMQTHNPGLGPLLAHARVLNRLDQILASILDSNLSCHCQVAEFKDHCLILVCSNATFATRIRMISPQLLDSFREECDLGIERIEIRIAPVNRPQPEVRKRRTLSPAAVQALGRFASDSGDAEIQAIFERINAHRNG